MLIGMRNAMFSGGGKLSAKSYVQDGLVAMWDGIENAGWGTHDPNATTWKDLSGNNHDMTINNGSFGLDCFTSGNTINSALANEISNPYQMEIVFRVRSFNVSYIFLGNKKRTFAFTDGYIFDGGNKFDGTGTTLGFFNVQDITGSINTYSAYKKWEEMYYPETAYVNGEMESVVQNKLNGWYGYSSLEFGINNYPWTYYGVVDYHSIRLYSCALTAAEIAANYAVDVARFNLPTA